MTNKEMLEQMMQMMSAMQAQMNQQQVDIDALKGGQTFGKKSAKKSAPKKPELIEFRKSDGTVVKVTAKQAAAWTKWRDGAGDRKDQFERMKADWADARKGYKPSKALVDAIKANRAAITHKVAKEAYGFIGTKQDLKALKESVCK